MLTQLATLLSIILAVLRVAPATLAAVQDRQQREREALAARRQQEKDARVDEAVARAQADSTPLPAATGPVSVPADRRADETSDEPKL